MNNFSSPVIECRNLKKCYTSGPLDVEVLNGINLTVEQGEVISIVGASGSGKSTLLHLLGGLDTPSGGEVLVLGQDINALSEQKRSSLRNHRLGFVYQFHHLLPEFTALENVSMPLLIAGEAIEQCVTQATAILGKMGLQHRLAHKVAELSGGERQRVAIARAVVTNPSCVLADEPTGNLDKHTAEQVFNTLLELNRNSNTSLILVTHDLELAKKADRILTLDDGQLIDKLVYK